MTLCTVYGDLLFFTDFLMDLALLFAVERFGGFKTRPVFLVLAASCGGVYSLVSLTAAGVFLRLWYGKALFSLFMVWLAFPRLTLKQFFSAYLYFYVVGFVMAGAVLCLSWFFRRSGWFEASFSYTAMGLSAAAVAALALSRWGRGYVRRNLRFNGATEPVILWLNGKKTELTALFDTGNELRDPVTGLPVVIVEFDAVSSLLPPDFKASFLRFPEADRAFSALSASPLSPRLRLIPFSSIGQSNGMMLGLRPDKLCFPQRGKKEAKDVVICFYRGTMRTRMNCRCIVNPAILDMI